MKKTIIDLGKLLMLSDKRTNKSKNFEANKQQIIEQFNDMILNLVKDDKKDNVQSQQPKEQSGQKKENYKKAVSVIKKYIEGKIQADDTNFYEVEKKDKKFRN